MSAAQKPGPGRRGGGGGASGRAFDAPIGPSQQPTVESPEDRPPVELLGPQEWHTLERRGHRRTYERGQVLFFEGDRGGSVIALRTACWKICPAILEVSVNG